MLLGRARDHFNEFDTVQRLVATSGKQMAFTEPDPQTGDLFLKVKVPDLDERLPAIAFDIVNNLRSALDHAVYDGARVLGGNPTPRNTKFPFGKDIDDVKRDLAKYKASEVPVAMHSVLLGFEPYKRGKEALWEFNEMRNQKIHRILQPMSLGSSGVDIGGSFERLHFHCDCSIWDDEKGELTFAILGPSSRMKPDAQIHPVLRIGLGPGTALGGYEAVEVFRHFLEVVDRVIQDIERETARLKVARPG
jgi:hypothetical protein